jgi:hypothetical protein
LRMTSRLVPLPVVNTRIYIYIYVRTHTHTYTHPNTHTHTVYRGKKNSPPVPSPSSSSSSSVSVLLILLYLKDGAARAASPAAITRCHRPRRIRSQERLLLLQPTPGQAHPWPSSSHVSSSYATLRSSNTGGLQLLLFFQMPWLSSCAVTVLGGFWSMLTFLMVFDVFWRLLVVFSLLRESSSVHVDGIS